MGDPDDEHGFTTDERAEHRARMRPFDGETARYARNLPSEVAHAQHRNGPAGTSDAELVREKRRNSCGLDL
jgi:hypothetical protein